MLTQQTGRDIKLTYEHDKELEVCELFNLTQISKNCKSKADAIGEDGLVSIKNSKSNSTQVLLTTLSKFRTQFDIPMGCIDLFLGDKQKNRFNLNEIPNALVNEALDYLNNNTVDIVRHLITGGENIASIIFRDLNDNKSYQLTTDSIISRVSHSSWVVGSRFGSFQLVDNNGSVLFHLQREGKGKSPNNMLFHVHKKLFTTV